MPIYEYQCDKCSKKFEALIFSAGDENNLKCPQCGSGEFHRLVSTCFSFGKAKSDSGAGVGRGAASCGSTGFS